MKAAAVYPDKKSLGLVNDYPEPKLASPSGVKLRVLKVGVCGTDREIASFRLWHASRGLRISRHRPRMPRRSCRSGPGSHGI